MFISFYVLLILSLFFFNCTYRIFVFRPTVEKVQLIATTIEDRCSQDRMNNKRKIESSNTRSTQKCIRTYTISSAETACTSRNNADNEIEDRSRILPFQTHRVDLFTCLPPEVITHVLSYLPLCDRKSIRLTCKTLNECSKHVSIAKREKLFFSGSRTVSSSNFREILLRTNYVILNLEFYGTKQSIESFPVHIWETCGDRVRNLYFGFSLGTQVLEDIFQNCRNLQVFGCRDPSNESSIHLGLALARLIQLNVVRTELRTLTFYAGSINSSLLQKIFTVFPNIKHLYATYRDLESKTECLKPFTQLQSFGYCPARSESIFWLEHLTTLESPMRLTDLRMQLCLSHLQPDAAFNTLLRFLASQNQVEKLSLTASADRREFGWGKLIMFHALRSCPKLRNFQFFSVREDVYLETSDEASEFLALISNLRSLDLTNMPCIPDDVLSLPCTNFAMNMLAVRAICTRPAGRFLFHILRHSPKMQHLMISADGLTTETFKEILRNMPELRTFGLRGSLFGDEFSSPADDYHIEKLESLYKYAQYYFQSATNSNTESNSLDLECLKLTLSPCHPLPVRKINFRRMRHVKFFFRQCSSPAQMSVVDQLLEVLWNMPTVETVELPNLKLENLHGYVELFHHLKNLRRFICAEVESHNLELLFKTCPKLKFVSTESRNGGQTFSFDSSAECVISEPYLNLREQGYASWY